MDGRRSLREPLQPFAFEPWRVERQPRDVSSGSREARDESISDRIVHGRNDDRDRVRHTLDCIASGVVRRHDDVDAETRHV